MTDMTAAAAAANWWAEAIGAPSFDNGGTDFANVVAGSLASMLADGHPVEEAQQKSFAMILQDSIEKGMEGRSWGYTLSVDYGPDETLSDAADAASISMARFPWKSCMWVYPDRVVAHKGYAAPDRLIWASDEWLTNRPVCGQQKWDDSKQDPNFSYHGDPWKCSLPQYHEEEHRYDSPLVLCTVCGRKNDWTHSSEYDHMPDFHTFLAPVDQAAS